MWVQGKPYRYGYAVSAKLPTSYGNALSKFDMESGTSKQWHEPGCIPVEPVMVPRPDAQAMTFSFSLTRISTGVHDLHSACGRSAARVIPKRE